LPWGTQLIRIRYRLGIVKAAHDGGLWPSAQSWKWRNYTGASKLDCVRADVHHAQERNERAEQEGVQQVPVQAVIFGPFLPPIAHRI
jgi:hypothetical protein